MAVFPIELIGRISKLIEPFFLKSEEKWQKYLWMCLYLEYPISLFWFQIIHKHIPARHLLYGLSF